MDDRASEPRSREEWEREVEDLTAQLRREVMGFEASLEAERSNERLAARIPTVLSFVSQPSAETQQRVAGDTKKHEQAAVRCRQEAAAARQRVVKLLDLASRLIGEISEAEGKGEKALRLLRRSSWGRYGDELRSAEQAWAGESQFLKELARKVEDAIRSARERVTAAEAAHKTARGLPPAVPVPVPIPPGGPTGGGFSPPLAGGLPQMPGGSLPPPSGIVIGPTGQVNSGVPIAPVPPAFRWRG